MQKIYTRTNPVPLETSENSNAKPVRRTEEALLELADQDAAQLRREPESTTQVVADVNSLIQRWLTSR
jgi:hypothetical protein